MRRGPTLLDRYYRLRSNYWRWQRLLFPSPAEIRFMKLLGAKVFTLPWLKLSKTGFCFTLVLSRGSQLRQAGMKRELRIGRCYVDFGNSLNWVIEIDGTPWHRDVVADFEREVYLQEFVRSQSRGREDVRIMRIPAARIWNNPRLVRHDVTRFLNA
jgi:very-short-patch-repair endonuclease